MLGGGGLVLGMTAGWGETEVLVDVSSRRLVLVQHRHLPAHGLLSFIRLLRAFLLNVIKRNRLTDCVRSDHRNTDIPGGFAVGAQMRGISLFPLV